MEKKIRNIKIFTILTCVIMFISIIILAVQFIKIANLREKAQNLEEYKTQLVEEINTYDAANAYYNRAEYLENYAREVLSWGKEGDTWYTAKK